VGIVMGAKKTDPTRYEREGSESVPNVFHNPVVAIVAIAILGLGGLVPAIYFLVREHRDLAAADRLRIQRALRSARVRPRVLQRPLRGVSARTPRVDVARDGEADELAAYAELGRPVKR
jgi:hypothetical protein